MVTFKTDRSAANYTTLLTVDQYPKKHADHRLPRDEIKVLPLVDVYFCTGIRSDFNEVNMTQLNLNAPNNSANHLNNNPFDGLIGESIAAQTLRQMARLAATSYHTLSLTGPQGSGKAFVARIVHSGSSRGDRPFYSVDCTTLHDTDILQNLVDLAGGGTLFLQRIDHLPPALQLELLRLLEGKAQQDFRLITATDQCLSSLISAGQFRSDLYCRMLTLNIPLPPLHRRKEDIIALIQYFLNDLVATDRFTPNSEALRLLMQHSWPGNIRELRSVVARTGLFHPGARVGEKTIAKMLAMGRPVRHAGIRHGRIAQNTAQPGFNLKSYLEIEEQRFLATALEQTNGNITDAAALAGMKRSTFIDRMQQYGLDNKP